MKTDKKNQLKQSNQSVLQKRLDEISQEIVNNKMTMSTGSLKNVRANKYLRKEVAFIKLLLSQKQLEKTATDKKETKEDK